MRSDGTRIKRGGNKAVLAAFASILLASCSTSDGDVPFGFATVGPADIATDSPDFAAATTNSASGPAFVSDENDPQLPDAVAVAPDLRPMSEAEQALAAAQAPATDEAATEAAAPVQQAGTQPETPQPPAAEQVASAPQAVEEQGSTDQEPGEPQATQFIENAAVETAAVAAPEPKKRGFLSSFFGTQARAATPQQPTRPPIRQQPRETASAAAPIVDLASTGPAPKPIVERSSPSGETALPGVRQNALFEIRRRSGLDDDSDIDLHEGEELYQVASAAGLARLAPNGLMKQTDHVDVACLKPSLVRVLKSIERHYGRKVVVTSGYRSPDRNRKARGARNSLHMYCAAADVQVEGVSKWDLAEYARSMMGRGGVGTYCHTNSVHIDVGPERDWNWRCRRRG